MRHNDQNALNDPAASRARHGKTCIGLLSAAAAMAVAAFHLPPTTASAGSAQGRRPPPYPAPHAGEGRGGGHGYGFLPGDEPPEIMEWQRARARRPTFWYGGPGFYRGRWNGGGFGPCCTPTPIGPHWNCG